MFSIVSLHIINSLAVLTHIMHPTDNPAAHHRTFQHWPHSEKSPLLAMGLISAKTLLLTLFFVRWATSTEVELSQYNGRQQYKWVGMSQSN